MIAGTIEKKEGRKEDMEGRYGRIRKEGRKIWNENMDGKYGRKTWKEERRIRKEERRYGKYGGKK
jgi:hypothetical protein